MPKKTNDINIQFDSKGKYVNNFKGTLPGRIDKDGKLELDKATKLDAKIGKEQLSVLDIGVRPKQNKISVTCTKCHQKFKIYEGQFSAYANDKGLPVCNSCMIG